MNSVHTMVPNPHGKAETTFFGVQFLLQIVPAPEIDVRYGVQLMKTLYCVGRQFCEQYVFVRYRTLAII